MQDNTSDTISEPQEILGMHACSIHGPNLKILPRQNDYLRYPKAHGKLARTISAKDRIDLLFAQLIQTFKLQLLKSTLSPALPIFLSSAGIARKRKNLDNHSALLL
ncbi:hypothetical protein OIU74_022447 [Salix koriyanagi]|uniref:Uncharacterized protein n=1 Tax=Salix koriyanagi TaxID=2511006 RepID=A0A9Q1AEZ8_9ROSI|nr:hypothetical protein OIU74_022447 [Salix koriyanagi]